ncbi:glycosyltransferase [Actinomycetes bacterium NPDC127524]
MKKQILKLVPLVLSFALVFSFLQNQAKGQIHPQNPGLSQSAAGLQGTMRKLWIDHTIWTRSYIVSAIDGLKDQDKVLTRLLKNQEDIRNAIKPYYGEAAGNTLTALLKEHILLAGKVIDAAKSGNQNDIKKYNAEWYKNADSLAAFLSKANPGWSKKDLQSLLYIHLKLVTDQVIPRIKKDWDAEILAYDMGEDHIIKLADYLSSGIIKQFPKKFQN